MSVRASAWGRAALVIVAVVVVDQLTKHAVRSGLAVGEQRAVLPGVQLVHVRNNGVAFGFLSGGGAIVLAFTLIALVLIAGFLTIRPERSLLWLPTGLLIGGALGNLYDRIDSGAVTDFIKLPLWPAFNCADISITFGVLALLYTLEGGRSTSRDDT